MNTSTGLKVVCCVKECKKVLQEGPGGNVSHGLCEACSTKMLWLEGVNQEELTDFIEKHKEVQVDDTKTRCCNVFYNYRANLINYEEFKRRLKVIDDELETKQTSLKLKEKEKKP